MKPCKRLHVKAIGINNDFSFHYAENGNLTECSDIKGKCGCIHAEINLLSKCSNPIVVILSHSPCLACAQALHKAKVKQVLFKTQYRKTEGIQYLMTHKIKIDQI